MNETQEAVLLAHKTLGVCADPDDDLRMMSRQFLRALERIDALEKTQNDLYAMNSRQAEGLRRVKRLLDKGLDVTAAKTAEFALIGRDGWPEGSDV